MPKTTANGHEGTRIWSKKTTKGGSRRGTCVHLRLDVFSISSRQFVSIRGFRICSFAATDRQPNSAQSADHFTDLRFVPARSRSVAAFPAFSALLRVPCVTPNLESAFSSCHTWSPERDPSNNLR